MKAEAPLGKQPENEDQLLVVKEVSKHFGGIAAVDGASLDVRRGSITALIGPNGAGKTTLFNVITGFFPPEAGYISLKGQRIEGKPPHAIARMGLVRTWQITKALTRMTVLDNMMLAAPDQPGESFWGVWLRAGASRKRERQVRERAHELLKLFELQKLAEDYAGTLSGGQRKLLELARALMAEPDIVLLDEPMAGVNPTLGRKLLTHMHRLRDERNKTFLFIEHDMEVVMTNAERVIVMAEGRVIADGDPHSVRENPAVVDAYLGTYASIPESG